MKSKLVKLTAGAGLLFATAAAYASANCCGDLACCLRMPVCCL